MKINTDSKKIKEVLTKGVEEAINKSHLEKRLKSGERLRIKFGIDPTSPDLHLGHSIPLRKLKEFQGLGHQVIFLIGDFSARIGDPSARTSIRKPLSGKEIKRNMKDYINQAAKILDVKKVEVKYNGEWYEKKKADFLMDLTSRFTYARLIERDEFKKRIKRGIDVSLLELIYPLLQGYDSVELKADVEIGGTDQKFNLLMGRKVQKRYGQSQQDIITLPLLIGTDGVNKMSKSYGNFIGLKEAPSKIYAKIMSIPDALTWHYFKLLTNLSLKQIEKIRKEAALTFLTKRDAKAALAHEVVGIYCGEKAAKEAEKEFEEVFKEKRLPSEIPKIKLKEKELNILNLLVKTKLAPSKAAAKRLVLQRGVKLDGVVQTDWRKIIEVKKDMVLQVGKRRFVKFR